MEGALAPLHLQLAGCQLTRHTSFSHLQVVAHTSNVELLAIKAKHLRTLPDETKYWLSDILTMVHDFNRKLMGIQAGPATLFNCFILYCLQEAGFALCCTNTTRVRVYVCVSFSSFSK